MNLVSCVYSNDATIQCTFQHWIELSLLEQVRVLLIEECTELGLVDWEWPAVDSAMGKVRLGEDQIGSNPIDRENGSEKSDLTEQDGRTLSVVLAGANVHGARLLD